MIAFAEAFRPFATQFTEFTGMEFDARFVSVPATLLLGVLVITKGASLGVKALWGVTAILAVSLTLFSLGHQTEEAQLLGAELFATVEDPDAFMIVFAIVFPAFTGMTAGVGLSGDLANPRKSIPLGVMSATVVGMFVYVWVTYKLASSATPLELANDQLIMQQIAVWGPIILIGLAGATISSAIGSILVAPRTMQALAMDRVTPLPRLNRFVGAGVGENNEPRNATLVTLVIALATVSLGNVDAVARVISMFFMVTYGALCSISALEHFAARPSYRPSFRSKWYISLLGAVTAFLLMFQIDPLYAILAILVMIGLYYSIRATRGGDDIAAIFQGVLTQITRFSQIKLQAGAMKQPSDWRPSVIMVNERSFERSAPIQFFGWLTHRYGVGTYMHLIRGQLDKTTYAESRTDLERLIRMMHANRRAIYVDTLVSPSMRSALAQALQLPGVSGIENNCIILEFSGGDDADLLKQVHEGVSLATATRVNSLVLRHGEHFFGARSSIHVWLTWHDYRNANLMILLAYILLGHPEWREAEVSIYAAFPKSDVVERSRQLHEMILSGRLPISTKNLRVIPTDADVDFDELVARSSSDADLVIFGFTEERSTEKGDALFRRHPDLKDVLFVSAVQQILIE
jgi:amino acid transporter